MFRPLSVVLVVLCALFACGGGDGDTAADRAAVPAAEAVTTTSTVVDEWAVPDPVTPEYVERVLTELYRIQGDALRLTVQEGAVTPSVIERLDSIYGSALANHYVTQLTDLALNHFATVKEPVGDAAISGTRVTDVKPNCLRVATEIDYSSVSTKQPQTVLVDVALESTTANKTGWRLVGLGVGGEATCA